VDIAVTGGTGTLGRAVVEELRTGRALRSGALVPGADAITGGPSFGAWLRAGAERPPGPRRRPRRSDGSTGADVS